jgi:hypothetical protein
MREPEEKNTTAVDDSDTMTMIIHPQTKTNKIPGSLVPSG